MSDLRAQGVWELGVPVLVDTGRIRNPRPLWGAAPLPHVCPWPQCPLFLLIHHRSSTSTAVGLLCNSSSQPLECCKQPVLQIHHPSPNSSPVGEIALVPRKRQAYTRSEYTASPIGLVVEEANGPANKRRDPAVVRKIRQL